MSNADHWLQYLVAEGIVVAQFRVKGDWGVFIKEREGTYFHFVAEGSLHFSLDDGTQTVLQAGDLVVLPQGAAHLMRSAPGSHVVSLGEFIRQSRSFYSEDSDATVVICGSLGIDRHMVMPAIRSLPPALHLKAYPQGASTPIADTLKQLRGEVDGGKLGSQTIVRNLLSALFIYVLRQWSETEKAQAGTWFSAMQNPRIAKALACIHHRPAHAWTIDMLAQEAGQSRSLFAKEFRDAVGETPHSYLTRWRLGIAAQLLVQTSLSVAAIADKVGYQSEYSFNRAFKQARGRTPTKEREMREVRPVQAPLVPA